MSAGNTPVSDSQNKNMDKQQFKKDVLAGLKAEPKYLLSKYFYDKKGDELFERIMRCKDYYLTRTELEIFKTRKGEIADAVTNGKKKIDVIALGPGDFSKTIHLIEELYERKKIEHCFPIDISENIIHNLKPVFASRFPDMTFHGLAGEYFTMMPEALRISKNPRLVLFVGATIGNFLPEEMHAFCKKLRSNLQKGDKVLIGFDLKKDPRKILAAYNDSEGWTAKFNLNLLTRINRELGADFNLRRFVHYPTYDPGIGACKSYLISTREQEVKIGTATLKFKEGEPIYAEVSQKYNLKQIEETAATTGYKSKAIFMDSKQYFVDVIWEVK